MEYQTRMATEVQQWAAGSMPMCLASRAAGQ